MGRIQIGTQAAVGLRKVCGVHMRQGVLRGFGECTYVLLGTDLKLCLVVVRNIHSGSHHGAHMHEPGPVFQGPPRQPQPRLAVTLALKGTKKVEQDTAGVNSS